MARSTQQVFNDHMDALARGDMPALMADYADDAVMLTIDQAYVGKAAIQGFFAATFAAMPHAKLTGTGLQVQGDYLLVSWTGDSDTVTVPNGNDTFYIHGDKIHMQSVWFTLLPK